MTIKPDSLAARIRAARKALGLTQPEFAAKLGVAFRTLVGWESGEHVPQGLQLKAVKKYLKK